MRSEALDITIESRGNAVYLILSGPFHNEQVPNIREKITGLINDGNRQIIIDMENVTEVNDLVVPMFLNLLNTIKGKSGELKLIFKNDVVSSSFSQFRNLFSIYADYKALSSGSFLNKIRHRSLLLSKKTGIRLSRPVAIFLLFVLCGWFITLGYIIHIQNRMIREQEVKIHDLKKWEQEAGFELQHLKERLRPLEQLGLARDSMPE